MAKNELERINQEIKNNNYNHILKSCEKVYKKGVLYTNHNSFRRYNPYTSNFEKIGENEVLEMFNNIFYNNWGHFKNIDLIKKHIPKIDVKLLDNFSNYLQSNDETDKAKKDFKKVLEIIKEFKWGVIYGIWRKIKRINNQTLS